MNRKEAAVFLPLMSEKFKAAGVVMRGCPETMKIVPFAEQADETDWPAEYLDLIVAVKVVGDMDEAMDHIAIYGSNHSEAIITSDYSRARRFVREVDASVVLVNASTRFNDGGQLGLRSRNGNKHFQASRIRPNGT